MKTRVWVAVLITTATIAGAVGWFVKQPIEYSRQYNSSDTTLAITSEGLRAEIIISTAEEKRNKLFFWNLSIKQAWQDPDLRDALSHSSVKPEFAEIEEVDNPLIHPTFYASVAVVNRGTLPLLIYKGPGYQFNQVAEYSRNHKIFVKREGVVFTNKSAPRWSCSSNSEKAYPAPEPLKRSYDAAYLEQGTSVKDEFWFVGDEFEFDACTPAKYQISGRVTVCILPTLEQVVLTTNEIEVEITAEQIRQYKNYKLRTNRK